MSKYYYTKAKRIQVRRLVRFSALGISLVGLLFVGYISFPLISWQVYFAPVFASETFAAPIPYDIIVNESTVRSLLSQVTTSAGVDYSNAATWFPGYKSEKVTPRIASYTISVPALLIKHAQVSTTDYDLDKHLVHYGGTAIPPESGNAVIFGHSTLPQLFNSKDYKTIFANAYKLKKGDAIIAEISDISYTYKIVSVTIVDPTDTSALAQTTDDSYLTLITCTPPGTTWKRLILKARIEKI